MEIDFGGVMSDGPEKKKWPGSSVQLPETDRPLTERERTKMAEDLQQKASVLDIYKRYNDNLRTAGTTPWRLNHGMKDGLTIEELFMIAVEGVAACLNDPMLVRDMRAGLEKRKEQKR